jgi:hypothetical protein
MVKKEKEALEQPPEAADEDYTGGPGQCHFAQCTKDICPVDDCQNEWRANCTGPKPAIYLADGHSGSSITTSALANLSGSYVSPWAPYWPELFGDNVAKADAIRSPVKFMTQFLCNCRRMYKTSRLMGFKWKTYGPHYKETKAYDEAWEYVAQHKIPVLWVLRNPLDILISSQLHFEQSQSPTTKSIRMVTSKSEKGSVSGNTLADKLNQMEDAKHKIRSKLNVMGVIHHVAHYEMLYHNDSAVKLSAWKSLFSFYGEDRVANTLTGPQLDSFINNYDQLGGSNTNIHSNGAPRSRKEIVENLDEVMAEYDRVMAERARLDQVAAAVPAAVPAATAPAAGTAPAAPAAAAAAAAPIAPSTPLAPAPTANLTNNNTNTLLSHDAPQFFFDD